MATPTDTVMRRIVSPRKGTLMLAIFARIGNDLLRLADQALYEAKNNGRNQVKVQWASSLTAAHSPQDEDYARLCSEVDEGPFQQMIRDDKVFSSN